MDTRITAAYKGECRGKLIFNYKNYFIQWIEELCKIEELCFLMNHSEAKHGCKSWVLCMCNDTYTPCIHSEWQPFKYFRIHYIAICLVPKVCSIGHIILIAEYRLNCLPLQQSIRKSSAKYNAFSKYCVSNVDPCANKRCPPYGRCRVQGGRAICECKETCSRTVERVCGSDGRSYDNECMLQAEACRTNTQITVASRGRCPGRLDNKPNDR